MSFAGVEGIVVEDEHERLERDPELRAIAPIDLRQESGATNVFSALSPPVVKALRQTRTVSSRTPNASADG